MFEPAQAAAALPLDGRLGAGTVGQDLQIDLIAQLRKEVLDLGQLGVAADDSVEL